MSWRDRARPIVAKAIKDARRQGLTGRDAKDFISLYYPFGERAMHPYKIWLDEVKRQLNEKPTPDDLSNYWRDLVGTGRSDT